MRTAAVDFRPGNRQLEFATAGQSKKVEMLRLNHLLFRVRHGSRAPFPGQNAPTAELVSGELSRRPCSSDSEDESGNASMVGATRRGSCTRSWQRFSLFFTVYAIGWGLNFVYYFLIANPLGYQVPQSTFLIRSAEPYSDLTLTWTQAKLPNPYFANSISTYFPAAYALLSKTRALTERSLMLAYSGLSLAAVCAVWSWWLRSQSMRWRDDARWPIVVTLSATLAVCNYPLLFAVDRGNLDPLAMCLLFLALELGARNQSVAGGLMLALASGLKGFPFAAVLLWCDRRRALGAATAVGGLVALIVIPAITFKGGIVASLRGLLDQLARYHEGYVVGVFSSHYSADWLNAARVLLRWRGVAFDWGTIVPWYEFAATIWAGLLSFLTLFVLQERWRKILAVGLIMVTFPNVANDYKLVFFLPAILEWLKSAAGNDWRSTLFGIAMALLMVPKHFYFPNANDVSSISCVISPLLISLASVALWPTLAEADRFRDLTQILGARLRGYLSARSDAARRHQHVT